MVDEIGSHTATPWSGLTSLQQLFSLRFVAICFTYELGMSISKSRKPKLVVKLRDSIVKFLIILDLGTQSHSTLKYEYICSWLPW